MIVLVIVFVICLAVSVIMAATRRQPDEPISVPESAMQKAKKQKVRTYAEHQKRMSKKRYLSEHSEYIYIPLPEAREIVEIQDQELIDGILSATLNGESAVKVKRETYNKFNNGKLQQNGD